MQRTTVLHGPTSQAEVATVDQDGVVTAVSAGMVTIRATSNDNNTLFDESEITVQAENMNPIADIDSYSVIENSVDNTFDVLLNDNDMDGDNGLLRIISVSEPDNGTATIAAGDQSILYTPNSDFTGGDQFTYSIIDENGAQSDPATVSITVAPNQLPTVVLNEVQFIPTGDFPKTITFSIASSGDMDGSIVDYEWNFGNLGSASNIINNTTDANVSHSYSTAGPYTITLTVTDNNGGTATDDIMITLEEPEEPSFTFTIDPLSGPADGYPINSNVPITFRITPNAAAIAQGITFTMSFSTSNSGITENFTYDGIPYSRLDEFSVTEGTSSGVYRTPPICTTVDLIFTVSSNLLLPEISRPVSINVNQYVRIGCLYRRIRLDFKLF